MFAHPLEREAADPRAAIDPGNSRFLEWVGVAAERTLAGSGSGFTGGMKWDVGLTIGALALEQEMETEDGGPLDFDERTDNGDRQRMTAILLKEGRAGGRLRTVEAIRTAAQCFLSRLPHPLAGVPLASSRPGCGVPGLAQRAEDRRDDRGALLLGRSRSDPDDGARP